MNPLKLTTVLIPIIIALLTIQFLAGLQTNPALYEQLIDTSFFTLNIFILLSWISFGLIGSIIYLLIFALLVLFNSELCNSYLLNIHTVTYVLLFLSIYFYDRRFKAYTGMQEAEIETLEKDINVLTDEYKQRQLQTKAFQKKFSKFAILKDVTEKLSTSLSLAEVANLVVRNSFNVIGKADICVFFLIDEKEHKLILASLRKSLEAKTVKVKEADYFDKRVFNKKQPLIIKEIRKDYRFDYEEIEKGIRPFRSLIATPLISKERSIGLIRLDSEKPDLFDTEDLRILNIIADLASVAVENAKLFEKTEELARTDSLTGCFVQRYMKELTDKEIKRAGDLNEKVSFLMIDVDHFKTYNDRYGHIAGDIVLREVGNEFRQFFPRSAIVARYGGEEFAIVLPETDKIEAKELAEEIRKKIKEKVVYLRRKQTSITISIGIATFSDDADNLEDLIGKADKALYKAKRTGRNKVCEV